MGAFTFLNEKKVKIWKVNVLKEEEFKQRFSYSDSLGEKKLGDILIADSKKGLFINAKEGILEVLEIQGENAKKMNVLDFLRGTKI